MDGVFVSFDFDLALQKWRQKDVSPSPSSYVTEVSKVVETIRKWLPLSNKD